MTLLALLRHGQTDWNFERRVQGRTDIPLNDTGRAQALVAADTLRGGDWTRIVASPLRRAEETAEIIASVLELDAPSTHAGLVERDYGQGEGVLVADFFARWGDGPVPGAETLDELATRAHDAIAEVAAVAPAEPTIVVAHGGLIRSLIGLATDGRLPAPGERLENASVTLFALEDSGLELVQYTTASA
ncbi:histidine phosphatase family protein [Microbacterium marinilacus]|uniref:Phosphatase PhoE n=1 Tax=Microbacterium marinilacus TaxID=415209 RepID=A0ABP7BIR3_9MICO|nr:histidine phosphatase family protein [Microbacterium marinilacus]MBY0688492.1 histidine phosphatase family protein [Microbacterium marinilacus]